MERLGHAHALPTTVKALLRAPGSDPESGAPGQADAEALAGEIRRFFAREEAKAPAMPVARSASTLA